MSKHKESPCLGTGADTENAVQDVTDSGSHTTESVAYGQHAFNLDTSEVNETEEELRQYVAENPVLTDIRKERTAWAIEQIRKLGPNPDWSLLRAATTAKLAQDVRDKNFGIKDGGKLPIPTHLPYQTAASMLLELDPIYRIGAPYIPDGDEQLGWYMTDGPDAGTYSSNDNVFTRKLLTLEDALTANERSEALGLMRAKASTVRVEQDPDLIPVNNGIIRYESSEFMPHDPSFVFTSKIGTDLKDNPKHPDLKLSNDKFFHVDELMLDLAAGDEEIVELLWQIIGAVLRPNEVWGKVAFLLGGGKNGKSTFIALLRNVVGPNVVANLRLHQLGKEFLTSQVVGKSAIIADENPPNTYLDDSADLKQIVMGENLLLNRKHKEPINYQFKGMVVQSFNDMPKTRDKSVGMYRRIIAVPFLQSFENKREFPEIKKVFVFDKRLHEYILHQSLIARPKFHEIWVPPAARRHLEKFKHSNDPLRGFWDLFREQFSWAFLPWDFVYDLYKQWVRFENPQGKTVSLETMKESLETVLEDDERWAIVKRQIRVKTLMREEELLVEKYKLPPVFNGGDPRHTSANAVEHYLKSKDRIYGGIIRRELVK